MSLSSGQCLRQQSVTSLRDLCLLFTAPFRSYLLSSACFISIAETSWNLLTKFRCKFFLQSQPLDTVSLMKFCHRIQFFLVSFNPHVTIVLPVQLFLDLSHSTITSVPAPISTQPATAFTETSSCSSTNASTRVMTTLSLSSGTTFEASPICSAR